MKLSLIPTNPTIRAYEGALAHFVSGALLYAAVAVCQYAAQHYSGVHLGTEYDVVINGGATRAIQSLYKFFKLKSDTFDGAQPEDADPLRG